jgi:FkbM family methyltransferase
MTPVETVERYERSLPVATCTRHGQKIHFSTPNRMTLWRVESVLDKEPETIAWVEGFAPGDVLLDVGANVGMYAIWAARVRQARVFAFEPEAQNYALLCRNIAINGLSERITAYCAALADTNGFGLLHVSTVSAGNSCHSFGESVNFRLEPQQFPFSQGSLAVRLDELVQANVVPVPRHVKIDVDGFEHKVVAGARATLSDAAVASILVEVNGELDAHRALVEQIAALGFRYAPDQVEASMRRDGPFKGCANYVFRR